MKIVTLLFAVWSVLPTLAAVSVVDFETQPNGAEVIIDNEKRGTTPLQLTDLKAGVAHHLRYELKDYEPKDVFFTLADGETSRLYEELNQTMGLLLVTSEPSGAEVRQNGYALGTTPRLITNLPTGREHTLLVSSPGYQDSSVSVRFNGRRPLVQHVKLVLDSGCLKVRTEPEGCLVTVNGLDRGAAPTEAIVKGQVTVEVRKSGYRPEVRQLSIAAGDEQDLLVQLEPLPGSLRLTSVPSGARFYLDDTPLVEGTPCVKTGLKPGTYRVRAELKGFGSETREVTIGLGEEAVEEFRLSSVMGSLEFKTRPAGAKVFVDGRFRGTTSTVDASSEWSDTYVIRDVLAGDHEIRFECPGHAAWTDHVQLEPQGVVQKKVTLRKAFTPDIRLTLVTGEIVEGVRLSEDASTLVLRGARGVDRPIPQDQIRKREAILSL